MKNRMMRVNVLFALVVSLGLFACSGRNNGLKKERLTRVWRSVRMENKETDSFLVRTQRYIDTFGKANSPDVNISVYGTDNVDSLRTRIQEQFDSTKNIMLRSVTNTTIEFRPDSAVYLSFDGAQDTSKWVLGPDNMLTLEDKNAGMNNEKVVWEIMELTDTSLVVKMKQDTTYSTVTFHPERK